MRSTEISDADAPENPVDGHAAQVDSSEEEPEIILKQLLSMLYNHEDRQAAVAAALKAVLFLQEEVRCLVSPCCSAPQLALVMDSQSNV